MLKSIKKILKKMINRLTPSCEIISQKVSESMDHRLPLSDRIAIRLHLMVCQFCNRYRLQLLAIRDALNEKTKLEEPPGTGNECLSDQAREKMKKALRERFQS